MEILIIIAAVISFSILNADVGGHFPPPLPKDRERELFRSLYDKNGDRDEARKLLIEHNLRLVAHIVKKYYSTAPKDFQDDLISIGTIGLIKAIDTFNIENGARFATYGAKCIQNEILMFFRSKKKTQNEVSIFETIDTDRDGNPLTYMDIIRCDDTIAEDIHIKNRVKAAIRYINSMPESREKTIIVMRYGLDGKAPLTQRETAEKLGISRSYVSRIEKNTLQNIKEYICSTNN